MGHGVAGGVREADLHFGHPELLGVAGRFAVQDDGGLATGKIDDFQFHEAHFVPDAGAESLGNGFLGGPAGGEGLRRLAVTSAIGDFMIGKAPFQKRVAKSLNGAGDACRFHQICANAVEVHPGYSAMTASISRTAV